MLVHSSGSLNLLLLDSDFQRDIDLKKIYFVVCLDLMLKAQKSYEICFVVCLDLKLETQKSLE